MTRPRECAKTEAVLAAMDGPAPPPELERHARACPACADAVLVGRFLAREAAAVEATAEVPGAGAVWRSARARIDAEALQRATRPIAVVRWLAWISGAAAGASTLARFHAEIGAWLGRLAPVGAGFTWELPAPEAFQGEGLFLVAGVLGLATVLFGLYAAWAGET